jgi:hypothetical protein
MSNNTVEGLRVGPLPAETDWLRLPPVRERVIGVDREKGIVRGFVVAEEGPFQSEGRGEFDRAALKTITRLMREEEHGLKMRLGHPGMSDDGLSRFLGRARDPFRDVIQRQKDGETIEVEVVRADLHISPVAMKQQADGGGISIGEHVMLRAETDPASFEASLVLEIEEELRLDAKGRPLKDDAGNDLPPLWRPRRLHAVDAVDDGDAVRGGFLSVLQEVRQLSPRQLLARAPQAAAEFLDQLFPGAGREVVEARCQAWLEKYLTRRFGEPEAPAALLVGDETPALDGVVWKEYIPGLTGPEAAPAPPSVDTLRRDRLRLLELED